MADSSLALDKLQNATRMLAEVRDAKDAKHVMDLASSAEYFARKAGLGDEAILYAHGIKIDAQTMLGRYLKESPKNEGAKGSVVTGTTRVPVKDETPTLAEIHVSKKDSANSQLLDTIKADMPVDHAKIRSGEKTITQVKREMRKTEALRQVVEMPSGKFRVLYADPPWKYGDTLAGDLSENYGGAEKHYPAMTVTELCVLPIPEVDDNAVLFLWVTSPLIYECAPVFRAWGFAYKAMFVWDKIKHNMGHYNSARHELLLICTRGSCTPDAPKLFDSVQSIERTTSHSQKPEEFRAIIDELYPAGRRVELFARRDVPANWEKWGIES